MSDQSVVLDDVHLTLTSKAGPVNILRGVSFTAERGESIAVLGPSGAGKSTLLAIVAGLERADRGRVVVSGTEIGGLMDERYIGQPWSWGKIVSVLEHLWIPVIVSGTSGTAISSSSVCMISRSPAIRRGGTCTGQASPRSCPR